MILCDILRFESEEFHHAGNSLVNLKVFAANRWKRVADMLETADGNRQILKYAFFHDLAKTMEDFSTFSYHARSESFWKKSQFLGRRVGC